MAADDLTSPRVATELAEAVDSDISWAPVSSRLLVNNDRRLDASTFLTDGYGLRRGLEGVSSTVKFMDVAEVWQPSRLKGHQVAESQGLPFLSAGQVFESQARVRKWLASGEIPHLDTRYVDLEWLLLSCSGEVGRVTAVYREHLSKVITHDLLRIVPRDMSIYGWLYAYMKTPTFFSIARSSQYGHMIKHLDPEHVNHMPVAMLEIEVQSRIGSLAVQALRMRQESRALQSEADKMYGNVVNPDGLSPSSAPFGAISSVDVLEGRRRLEGQFHRPDVRSIEDMVVGSGNRAERLGSVVDSVSVGARFKRYFGDNGVPYRSASELFDVNPPVTKRVYSALLPDSGRYLLRAGWIIMACSGQTYGLLGRTTVLTDRHEGVFGSHDLIRIVPNRELARTGYIHTVLNHVEYGRPRVVRYASGTSVPHLDPVDIAGILIPRLDSSVEARIADLSEESVRLSAAADELESSAIFEAEQAISHLTRRHVSPAWGS